MKALLLILWGGAAAAQDVAVRSGEHDGFTRLVLSTPAGTPWELVPTAEGYEIALPPSLGYDLSEAFARIGRDRVADLVPAGPGALRLDLGCDCHAVTFLDGPSLVIDVTDGPPPEGADVAEGPEAPARPRGAPVAAEAADAAADATRDAVVEGFMRAAALGLLDVAAPLPEEGPLAPEADAGPAEPGHAEPSHAEPGHSANPELAPSELDVLADAPPEVTPAPLPADLPTDLPAAPAPPEASTPPAPRPEARPTADPFAALAGQPGLSLRTGLDGALADPPRPLAAEGNPCLPPEALDLAAWAPSGNFGAEVPARASALFTERDLWTEGAVEDLARALIAFGFGREAALALRSDGQSSAGRDLLLALAAIVDGDPAPGALADQGGCLGPVALWRALARGTLEGTDAAERTSMTVALRALPDALRGHLGVALAGLFLDAGDAATAGAIMEGARGEVTGAGTVAGLAGAAVAEATAGPAAAIADLAALAAEDPRMTPAGVLRLIDLSLAEGRIVDDATLLLAQSLRFENEAEGPALLLAQARGLSAQGRFDEAFALLAADGAILPPAEADAAVNAVVADLLGGLGDAGVLEWALGRRPAGLPAPSLRAVAARLDAMGFAPEAETLLASGGGAAEARDPLPEAPPGEAPAASPDAPSSEATPPSDAPPEDSPALPLDVLPVPPAASTLADRRAVLDRAGEARGQAEALLATPLGG